MRLHGEVARPGETAASPPSVTVCKEETSRSDKTTEGRYFPPLASCAVKTVSPEAKVPFWDRASPTFLLLLQLNLKLPQIHETPTCPSTRSQNKNKAITSHPYPNSVPLLKAVYRRQPHGFFASQNIQLCITLSLSGLSVSIYQTIQEPLTVCIYHKRSGNEDHRRFSPDWANMNPSPSPSHAGGTLPHQPTQIQSDNGNPPHPTYQARGTDANYWEAM